MFYIFHTMSFLSGEKKNLFTHVNQLKCPPAEARLPVHLPASHLKTWAIKHPGLGAGDLAQW